MNDSILASDITIQKIQLRVLLKKSAISKQPVTSLYDLVLFTSGDVTTNTPAHAALRRLVSITVTDLSSSIIGCTIPIDKRFASPYLHVYMYAKYPMYTTYTGQGRVPLNVIGVGNKAAKIYIRDATNETVGSIDLRPQFVKLPMLLGPLNKHASNHTIESISNEYQHTMQQYVKGWNKNAFYAYVTTSRDGVWPILSWAYMSTQVTRGRGVSNLVSALFEIAAGETLYDRIGDALTMITRNMIYKNDTVIKNQKRITAEHWNRLGVHPHNATRQSFDCEDGAEFVMSLIYYIQNNRSMFAPPVLHRDVYDHIGRFTPCFTIGTIYNSETNSYDPHAWVTLIDSRYLNSKLKGLDVAYIQDAILTLETTAYVQSTTGSDEPKANERYKSMLNEIKPIQHTAWGKCLNFKRPFRSHLQSRKFGIVSTLLIADHKQSNGGSAMLHVTMIDTKTGFAGVAFDDFAMSRSNVRYQPYVSYDHARYPSHCGLPLYTQPMTQLPDACVDLIEYKRNSNEFLMTGIDRVYELNERVYDKYEHEILNAGFVRLTAIPLTRDLSVVRLTKRPSN